MESTHKKPAAKRVAKKEPAKTSTARTTTSPAHKASSAKGYIQAVGRRKNAVARVRLHSTGDGSYTINGKKYDDYFPYQLWREVVISPLPVVGLQGTATITVRVQGGGINAQSEAIRLGLSRALIVHNPDWRPTLRKLGWLTRDARKKERKKPGLKRARRAPQWQKR